MATAKRENSLHVRICDEADSALELMCTVNDRDKAALAAQLLEEVLLGRAHALKVAAVRFVRSGLAGSGRDRDE